MQPLTVDFIQSLDGFGAAEGWPGFWGMEGPEYLGWMADSPENEHPILMGANTYRLMHGMVQEGEPGTDVLGPIPKYVFSRSMTEVDWGRATLVRGDAVEAVRELKETSDLPLRTLGSAALCASLVRAGLVDRVRTVVFPVVTGATGADPVFAGWPDVTLELVDHQLFDGRLQLLEYVPTVLDAPPLAAAG